MSAPASAQAQFQLPEACGTEAEFERELEALLGDAARTAKPAALAITEVAPGSYELRMQVGGERRELRDPDCRALFDSAVVIAAATWRDAPARGAPSGAQSEPPAPPSAAGRNSPPRTGPPAPAPPRVKPPAAAPPRVRPTPPAARRTSARAVRRRAGRRAAAQRAAAQRAAARRAAAQRPGAVASETGRGAALRGWVAAGAGISGGILPDLGPLWELGAGISSGRWGWSFSLCHRPERSTARDGRGLDVTAWGGSTSAVVELVAGGHLLLGVEANRLSGSGRQGVAGRDAAAAWHVAASAGLGVILWNFESLRLELQALGHVSLVRPRFVVTGFGDVYRVPALGADATLRGVWFFR